MHYPLLHCLIHVLFLFVFFTQPGEHGHWYSGLQQAGIQGRHHRCEAEGESWVGLIDLPCAPGYCAYHPNHSHYRYIDAVL